LVAFSPVPSPSDGTAVGPDVVVVEDAGGDDQAIPERGAGIPARILAFARALGPTARGLVAFLLYLIAAIVVWAGPILSDFDARYVGDGFWDSKSYQWFMGWMHWSLSNGHDPLFTREIFTPAGTSLAWNAFTPAAGILMYPVRSLFGSLVATNTILVLSSALACWAAYLVCHRLTKAFWPSIAGGYLFGFSQYMVGQLHGHVNLVLIFPVPLCVYLVIRRIEGSMGRIAFVGLMTLSLIALFLSSTELYGMTAFFGSIAFLIAILLAGGRWRQVLWAGILTAGAFALSALAVFPYIAAIVRNAPPETLHDLTRASSDLASFVVPRVITLVSTDATIRWSETFRPLAVEDAAYLSIPLIGMLIWFAIDQRRRKETWGLLAFIVIVSVAALGPVLHVMGRESVTMPWSLATHLPLIKNAIPSRFSGYSALAIGVVAAVWLARSSPKTAPFKWGLVILGAIMLFPNQDRIAHVPQTVPAFFTSGDYRNVLHQDEVIVGIPKERAGDMLWQDETDFWFRMATGYIGPLPQGYDGEPLNKGLQATVGPSVSPAAFAAWLNERTATAIVLADAGKESYEPLIRSVGGEIVYEGGGVSVWRAPSGTWSAEGEG
jgi:hypothetical protein